jgi:hypothetical protein
MLRRRHARIGQWQLDILKDVEFADQLKILKDEADFAVSNARPVPKLQIFDRPAVQRVFSFGRRVQQTNDREQCRFAATGRPPDRDVLAPVDLRSPDGSRKGCAFPPLPYRTPRSCSSGE